MEFNITVLPGDSVGSEVVTEALKVLHAVGDRFGHSFNSNEGLTGGVVIDSLGKALSYETLNIVVGYGKAELER